MERLKEWVASNWYPILITLGTFFFIALLFWFQLGRLVPGFSESEVMYSESFSSLQAVIKNPLSLPHKLVDLLFSWINEDLPAARIASTIFGFILVGCFWFLLRTWYSRRVAFLGTTLFICSAWLLHVSRFGTDDIMYSLLILPIAAAIWMQKTKSNFSVVINALILILLMYVPGFIWFLAPLFVWQSKRIYRYLKKQNPLTVMSVFLIALFLMSPLIIAMTQNSDLATAYLGLPAELPTAREFVKNLVFVPVRLLVLGPNDPEIWLGRLPLLSWFSSIMFLTGVYAYFFKRSLDRTWFIAYVFVGGSALVALDGPIKIHILLPFAYLVVSGGIALMLQQWFTVFPRNPLARIIGPTLMTVVVILTVYYNITHYFIAWPNTPETKSAYGKKIEANPEEGGALLLQ